MTRLRGFILCLFDSHDLEYEAQCDWLVCRRCQEVRLTEGERAALAAQEGWRR